MPCDTIRLSPEQTLAQRMEEVQKALKELEQKLLSGSVRVVIGANGAVTFTGWSKTDRRGLTDVCAYRTLAMQNSWALRQAVAKTGRKVNVNAVAAGVHSHDGGHTWGKH